MNPCKNSNTILREYYMSNYGIAHEKYVKINSLGNVFKSNTINDYGYINTIDRTLLDVLYKLS